MWTSFNLRKNPLSKAFNTVDKKNLISTLPKYDAIKNNSEWFKTYPDNGKLFARNNSKKTSLTRLSPMVVLIYVNGLCNVLKVLTHKKFTEYTISSFLVVMETLFCHR